MKTSVFQDINLEVDRSLAVEKLVHIRGLVFFSESGKGPKVGWGKFKWESTFYAFSQDKCKTQLSKSNTAGWSAV